MTDSNGMRSVHTLEETRRIIGAWRRAGERIVFVPTMGNLHAGHISLLTHARQHGERFVASIFVNPMQFGPNEDFNHYPRTPTQDADLLRAAGCDLLFVPDVAEIYPRGQEAATRVVVPELSDILCGAVRPGHFAGVTSVVARLFGIVQPDVAIFGRKDFQQLAIIRRMVADLCWPIQIIGAPTVRADDGLALSSRNQYLSADERAVAPILYRCLQQAVQSLGNLTGEQDAWPQAIATIESEGRARLEAAGLQVDYLAVRESESLAPCRSPKIPGVVLVAARLGRARLIDNLEFAGELSE